MKAFTASTREPEMKALMHISRQLENLEFVLLSIDSTLELIAYGKDTSTPRQETPEQVRAMFAAHAADLRQTLNEPADRELSEITLTNVVPETEDDKQGLGKWLEQLDKCKCPIQVRIVHEDCCERREQDDST